MEISEFHTSNDENYVPVGLPSENDDEDETDEVSLDTIPLCPPKDLLGGQSCPDTESESDNTSSLSEEDRYTAMSSGPHHRFLSDHQYLVGSSMHHIIPHDNTDHQISIHVPHSSERFSVSYDMDIRTQDLFNKENPHNGEYSNHGTLDNHRGDSTVNEDRLNGNIVPEDAAMIHCKIEIGEELVQEQVYSMDCVSYEEITSDYAIPATDEDEDARRIVSTLLNGIPRLSGDHGTDCGWLENDHSYTTLIDDPTQPTGNKELHTRDDVAERDENTEVTNLVALSQKLEKERDITSANAKQITEQIERTVKFVRNHQQKYSEVLDGAKRIVREESRSDTDSLSVVLSTNCSERLENDGGITSSHENGNDDSGTDTEFIVPQKRISIPEKVVAASDLDQLLSLGDSFTKQCEEWLDKQPSENGTRHTDTAKISRLLNIFDTVKRKLIRVSSPPPDCLKNGTLSEKVETAVQTYDANMSSEREKRTLNEEYKKNMLASDSDSSLLSVRNGSSGTMNSDSETENIMNDFVRRRRMRKSIKDMRNKTRLTTDMSNGSDGGRERVGTHRRKQIYTDSSSESDGKKKSSAKGREDRAEGEDNLLEGVLSGVDDIILDVHDILPAAEHVLQDFLEKEEVRNKNQEKENSDGSTLAKNVSKMTESELEEYNEAQEDKEIDRLCNITYLSQGRSTTATVASAGGNSIAESVAVKGKELQRKMKKVQNTMEDFLNDENSDTTIPLVPSDNSDGSDKEAVDTEEQFLQKCNESMKYQLLHQLSSSSSSTHDSDEDRVTHRSLSRDVEEKLSSNDESDASSESILESFLKRMDTKRGERKVYKNAPGTGAIDAENLPENGVVTGIEQKQPQESGSGDETLADGSIGKDEAKDNHKVMEKPEKLGLADPKDRALFNRDLFKDVDDTQRDVSKPVAARPTKVERSKRLNSFGKATLSSDSDADSDKSSADSDVELLNESPKKRKRIRNPSPSQEPFDYNDPLLTERSTRKETLAIGGVKNAGGGGCVGSSGDTAKTEQSPTQSPSAKIAVSATGLSPAGGESNSSAATTTKQKTTTKDEQDCISLSSESEAETEAVTGDLDDSGSKAPHDNKRKIRAMLTNDELAEETKKAQKEEEGRATRLKKKNEMLKKFLHSFRPRDGESELVLDYDSTQKQAICVHPDIVKLLKPHQIEGIKFMYDNTYGSVDALPKHPGSGCILAHCMGLGKTLQMIALLHTVMRYPQLLTRRMLVICPKSTVMNWKEEIIRWQGTIKTGHQMRVYCFADVCTQADKISVLKKWFSCAAPNCGVMLIGYEAFRALINYERRKRSVELPRSSKLERIKEYLLNPGADLVICDEGHQIKNKRSAISEAVSKIKTKRRIMLTGTPIQNNLKEYYCMVNFIKPSFLGSDKEFSNLYANPIKNGQCKDSDQRAIKIMKQRSYVLHNKLSKFVQRKEAAVLKEFLPEKYEYVLFVPLTPVQERMYEVFLRMNEYTSSTDIAGEPGRTKKFKLIADYTSLRKIWTHPKVLEKAWESANLEKNRRDAARKTATPDSYDESPDDNNDIASGQLSVTNDWWRQYLEVADLESLFPSNKLWIMFEILKHCNDRGEKCLIFSAFVAVLNVVEHFMAKINNQSEDQQQSDAYAYSAFKGPWEPRKDYYRLDGKTHKSDRHRMITSFNDPRNTRTKCFLISAKAGGQGINLTGANRVIILDTSWNPSNDQQNIFRIFRLGQKRKCYVYRLLAMGTMEEKVYSRSVTKQALSFRVVDEQQIDRHYSYGELAELYTLSKVSEMSRETPILPADDVLCLLLRLFPNKIFKYHEHDSLLENKPEQDLSEEDKKEAWAAYEREIQSNDNRSLMSAAWSSVSQAGLFGQLGPYNRLMDYWGSLGYPGIGGPSLPGSGGEMFRTDFSYNRSLYNAYANVQQQQYSMLNDSPYSSLLPKSYPGYNVPGAGPLDFASSSMLNGQPPTSMGGLGGAGKPYDPTAALASFFSTYSTKSTAAGAASSGSSSNMGVPNQSSFPSASSSPLGAAPPYNGMNSSATASAHFNALSHMNDYNALSSALHNSAQQSSGLTISSISSLAQHHKTTAPIATGQPSGIGSNNNSSGGSNMSQNNTSMLSMLSEQAQLAAAVAAVSASPFASPGLSSNPYSPRSVPLLPPTIETQMRNFMGKTAKPSEPAGISSRKTQSPMPQSQAMSNSAPTVSLTSAGPQVDRANSSLSTVPTTLGGTMPLITSVMSMAPHGAPIPLDPPYKRPADSAMQHIGGTSKQFTERNKPRNTPPPALPASATSVNRSAMAQGSSPTIIPSDDEDEENVTNEVVPPYVKARNVPSGASEATKESERAAGSSEMGMVYGVGSAKTKPSQSHVTMKDLMKNANSLNSLTQTKQAVQQSPTPAVGVKAAANTISQTPPPIISSPEVRPFQTLVRAGSSTLFTSPGTNQPTSGKAAGKMKIQSPLAGTKLIPSATKTVQQQQHITKPLPIPPARSTTAAQQPVAKTLPITKIVPSTTATGQLTKSPSNLSVVPVYPGHTVSSAVPAPSSKAVSSTAIINKLPSGTSVITSRQPSSVITSNVTRTIPKPSPEVPGNQQQSTKAPSGMLSAVKPPASGTNAISALSNAGLAGPKTNVTVGSANSRVAESRPITLSLTPLQTANAKNKKLVPLLPKMVPNNPSTVPTITTVGNPSSRNSPVGMRPISTIVQKPSVPSPTNAKPATTFSSSLAPNPASTNRTTSTVGTAKAISTTNHSPVHVTSQNPIRVPTGASSSTVANRLTNGPPTSSKTRPVINGTTKTVIRTASASPVSIAGSPALPAFTSRPLQTGGSKAMTIIPTHNIIDKSAPMASTTIPTNPKSTLSYNIKNGNQPGGYVITKATASPTIRQILPAQGGQHVVVKSPMPTTLATSKASTQVRPTVSSGSPARQVVQTIGLRTGNSSTPSTTLPMGHFQPGGTNNVFIRKRKSDATLLESPKATKNGSIESPGAFKRSKPDESLKSSTSLQSTAFAATNRLGAGITITPKDNGAKARVEIVEIE